MKKNVLLTFLTFCSLTFGQTIDKLDDKNGFKTIKLDDPISIYSSNIKLFKNFSEDNLVKYIYYPTNSDLYNVFQTEMDEIYLFFKNDTKKLVGITLIKRYNPLNNDDVQNFINDNLTILDSLKNVFGKYTDTIHTDAPSETEKGAYWQGQRVHLQFSAPFSGPNAGSNITINIFKQSFIDTTLENNDKSGF